MKTLSILAMMAFALSGCSSSKSEIRKPSWRAPDPNAPWWDAAWEGTTPKHKNDCALFFIQDGDGSVRMKVDGQDDSKEEESDNELHRTRDSTVVMRNASLRFTENEINEMVAALKKNSDYKYEFKEKGTEVKIRFEDGKPRYAYLYMKENGREMEGICGSMKRSKIW